MADLGIFDIVALSKAGYKKKDIDAIIAGEMAKPIEPQEPADPTPTAQSSMITPDKPEEAKDGESPNESKPEDQTDYKTLYENLIKEQEAQKKTIKDLQAQINTQNRAGAPAEPYDPSKELMASLQSFS